MTVKPDEPPVSTPTREGDKPMPTNAEPTKEDREVVKSMVGSYSEFRAQIIAAYRVKLQAEALKPVEEERDKYRSAFNGAKNCLETAQANADTFREERDRLRAQLEEAQGTAEVRLEAMKAHERTIEGLKAKLDFWRLRAERAEQQLAEQVAEARREGAREALHMGEPWPIPDILNRLAGAAEHLLSVHSCDAHGYEGVDAAIKAARALSDEPPKEGESR